MQNNRWTQLSPEEKAYCYKQDEKMDAFPHRQLCQTCKQILYFNANGEVRVRPNMCNTCDQIFRNINCVLNAQRWANLNSTLGKILGYLEKQEKHEKEKANDSCPPPPPSPFNDLTSTLLPPPKSDEKYWTLWNDNTF